MPLAKTNELKERVQLYAWKTRENDEGELIRQKKFIGWRWASLAPCSLSSIALSKILIQTPDARASMMKAYTLTLRYREKDTFDGMDWLGETYRRISPIQRDGAFNRCIIAAFEDKSL